MKNKIPAAVFLFFILIYGNQGISSLPSQALYYLTRETWGLSASMIGVIALISGLAWSIKPLFGILSDNFPIKKYSTKYYLYINNAILIVVPIYILMYGLNFISLIVTGALINLATAFNDVCNDTQMVKLEQKLNLKGRIQAVQWISLGVTSLISAIGGAWIADKLPEPWSYKVAFLVCMIIPVVTILYLNKMYKETPIKRRVPFNLKRCLSYLKDKELLIGMLFIMLLRVSPCFGTPLMIKMREELFVDKMFLGYLGALSTAVSLIGYGLYYWKAYKFPMKKLLYFSILFTGVANLAYLFIPNKWMVLVYGLAFGAFDGISFLTMLAFMARIVPKGAEGLFYAFLTSVNNLSSRIGVVLGGVLFDRFGYNSTVISASLLTFLCLFFIPHIKEAKRVEEKSS